MKRRAKVWSALVACLIAPLAQAHAHLESSTPADGSTLSAVPATLEMRFSEPARLTALSIQRDQEPKQALKQLPTSTDRTQRVALPVLPPGEYHIGWRVMSADGHVASGAFHFTIAPGAR